MTPGGDPFTTGTQMFSNLTAVNPVEGFYRVTAADTVIGKTAAAAADMKISAATNGAFADTYTILPLVAGTGLRRDFLRAYVIPSLNSYLLGNAPATEPSVLYGTAPLVRDNEQITLLARGNECLGQSAWL